MIKSNYKKAHQKDLNQKKTIPQNPKNQIHKLIKKNRNWRQKLLKVIKNLKTTHLMETRAQNLKI